MEKSTDSFLSKKHSHTKTICLRFPLKTRLRTEQSFALSPSTTKKSAINISQKALKYGYASCSLGSINAERLENIVMAYGIWKTSI